MRFQRRVLFVLLCLCAACSAVSVSGAADVAKIDPVGRPKEFKAGKRTVCAIWYEEGAWHLRATANKDPKGDAGPKEIIAGTVTVQKGRIVKGELEGIEAAQKPKKYGKNRKRDRKAAKAEATDDDIAVHKDKTGFDFRFVNRGKSDGLSFTVSDKSETLTFHVTIGGDDNPKQIIVGVDAANPDGSTFTLPAKPEQAAAPAK